MFAKAGRWVAEMEEIAAYAGDGERAEGGIYDALAQLYERLSADFEGGQEEISVLRDTFK
jgi:hypothetical protein